MKKLSEYGDLFLLITLLGFVIAPYLQDDLFGNIVASIALICLTMFLIVAIYTIGRAVWNVDRIHKRGASFTSLGVLFCHQFRHKFWYYTSRAINFLALRANSMSFLYFALRVNTHAEQAIREYEAAQDRVIDELANAEN